MLGEGLHCGLDIWGELSRGQTAPSHFPFPALSTSPPLRNADSRTHDNPQMKNGAASLPAVTVFVLARGKSCCPAAHYSPLSTAEEKGVVSAGKTYWLVFTQPRPPRHGPALPRQNPILLGHFNGKSFPTSRATLASPNSTWR